MSGAFESDYHDGDSRNTSLRASEAKDKPMHSKAIEAAVCAVEAINGYNGDRNAQLAQAAVQSYLAAMEAEGFVMVPVEPSGRALQKGLSVISEFLGGDPTIGDARMIYSAMLAARPQPKD